MACQRCRRANTTCTSQGSQHNASLTPASEPIIDPQNDLQSNCDLDFEGIGFTFYKEFDEPEPDFISPSTASEGIQGIAFSPYDNSDSFMLGQQANDAVSGYLKSANTQTLSAVRNSRSSVAEGMSRSEFESFVGQREPTLSLSNNNAFNGMNISNSAQDSKLGLGGELSNTTLFGKRRKAPLESKLL